MTAAKQMRSVLDVKRSGLTHNINEMKRAFELLARMVADKGVRVVFRGTTCATDHKTIYLPELSLLERSNMTEQEVVEAQSFLDTVRGYLFHEVAHILFTDDAVFQKGAAESPLVRHGMNAVEDVRIEKKMASLWRGAGVSLRHMNEWMLRKIQDEMAKSPIVGKVIVGIAWVARTGSDHWFYKNLDDETKALLGKFAAEIRAARNIESTDEALLLGRRIEKKLKALGEGESEKEPEGGQPSNESSDGGSEGEDGEGKGKGKRGKGDGAKGKKQGKSEEENNDESSGEEGEGDEEEGEGSDGRSEPSDAEGDEDEAGGGGDDESGEEGEGDGGEGDGEENEPSSGGGDGAPDDEALNDAIDQLRDELNSLDQASIQMDQMADKGRHIGSFIQPSGSDGKYRPFTTEFDVAEAAHQQPLTTYVKMMEEARKHFGVLKRNLQNILRARANVMTVSELEEGELDSSLLYKLATRRSDKVFKEDIEHLDTNVAVVLLVNESGSMGGWSGYSGNMTRIELARVTAALMGEVLDSLGIKFACYGHTTGSNAHNVFWSANEKDQETFTRWGSTQVYVYKDFDESFGATKTRIPSMMARNNTHDAEALIFAANKLIPLKGVERRIIMTLDDGRPEPNTPGCSNSMYENGQYIQKRATRIAQENVANMSRMHQDYVREVVKMLDAQHIEVLGMGMGTEDVKHFYPKHVVVNDVASFPAVALKELRRLLLSPTKK